MASSKPQASQTSTSKSYKAHTHHHHNPPIPHNQRVNNQSDPELEARCKANIVSLHLSAEEQLAESEGFKGVDWLKEEGTWPPAAQQRVHRYMHHHDLYQVTNINDPIFVDLVNLVKSEAGVPNTRNWEHKVPAKCTDLINMSTRAWKRDGLLVTHNNVIMKSPPFQYLWDCAVQAAQVSSSTGLSAEQNLPFSSPENEARSIDCSSVNRAAEALEGSYAHKRNAESTPQSWVARTAKRARRAQYDDDDGNSITVDLNNDWGSDQETQLDDSREGHPATASAAGTSAGVPHKGHNTTSYTCYGNSQRDVAPTIQAARDALSALYSTEDTSAQGTTAQREDTGFAHNGNPANFVVGSNRTPVSSLSGQDDYRTQNLSYGRSKDGRESSAQSCSALTDENHPRAACPMPPPVSPPSMSQCDNSSSAISPGPQRSWNTAPLDTSLNPEGSERPAASSQASQETEQGSKISLPGMRTIGLLTDDTSQISQTDRREHPLNLKRTPEGTQAVSISNHKSITADKVQSNLAGQRMEIASSSSDWGVEEDGASTSSEDSGDSESVEKENSPNSPADFCRSVVQADIALDSSTSRDTSRRVSTNPAPLAGMLRPGEISNDSHQNTSTDGVALEPQRQNMGINGLIYHNGNSTGIEEDPGNILGHNQPSLDARRNNPSSVQEIGSTGLVSSNHQGLPAMRQVSSPSRPPSSSTPNSQNAFPECSRGRHIPGCPHPFPQRHPRPSYPAIDPQTQHQFPPPPRSQYQHHPLNSIQPPPPPHLQYQSEPPSTLHLQNQNQNQPPPRPPPPPSTQYKPQPPHSQYQHISPYQNQPPPSSQPQNQNCRPPPPPQGIPQQVGETGPSNTIEAAHMQLANGIEPNNLIAQHFRNMPGGANASAQVRSLAGYQANLSQQQAAQMPNIKKPTPNLGGPQNQGPTVMGGGQDGGVVANYYNPGELGPSPRYQPPPPHPQCQSQPPASSQPQNQHQQPPRLPPPPLAQYQPPPPHPQYQNQPPPSSQPPDQSQRLPLDLSHSSPPPVKALSQVPSPPASSCQPVSPKTALPESNSPSSDQPRFENGSQWKWFLETIQIVIPRYAQPGTNLHHAATGIYTAPISCMDQGVTDFFQWFSSIVETGKDSVLKFDFVDGFKQLRLTIWVPCGDPLTFESARIAAWNLFQQADLDPGLANLKVVITAHLEIPRGVNTNVHMQPHCLDPITTTSDARHDYHPAMPLQNSDNVKTAPDAAASLAKPQLRSAPSDPPSRLSPPNSRPSRCDLALNTTIGEPSYANSSEAGKESPMAFALPSQEVQLQPSQQQSRLQNQSSRQTTSTTNPTTEIVIRLQVDGYGRFSRGYGKYVLNTKVANGRFFDWFALETGHKDPQKLRFDFKDALPPKSCVIERDQDDYFELMVHDIRRKFKHARERTPDMKEFAILVTDPTWHSESEEEDDDM